MRFLKLAVLLALPAFVGCFESHQIWHDQVLPSGKTIKVTSFNLVWGIEHGERDVRQDCLALRFVSADPKADPAAQELEAWETFELIRAVSELWGFKSASIVALPSVEWKGRYEVFNFTRAPDGQWSMARVTDQVFGKN